MKILDVSWADEECWVDASRVFLTIGTFDGVHVGHRLLMNRTILSAQKKFGVAVVVTFWPYPTFVTASMAPKPMIFSQEKKMRILEAVGVDVVVRLKFDDHLMEVTPECFWDGLKMRLPGLKKVFVGENFHFGKDASGNAQWLLKKCDAHGVGMEIVPFVRLYGETVSSSRIRKWIAEGAWSRVKEALKQPEVVVSDEGSLLK